MSIAKVIKSIAVIGGGPAGIVTLNELLHTAKSGVSTLKTGVRPIDPAFKKVVCFEQNPTWGGVWNFFEKPDPKLPLDLSCNYSNPDHIYEKTQIPAGSLLEKTSWQNPFVQESKKYFSEEVKWQRNAAYKDLFTNIPEPYMKFSYHEYKELKTNEHISPLVTSSDVRGYLGSLIQKYGLEPHFRFNTTIERVEKAGDSWKLTIRQKDNQTKTEKWYCEYYDAVVAANGHCSVPFIPTIPGLVEYNEKYPGAVSHSKAFRDSNEYQDEDVLLLGSGTSSIDLAQYIIPKAKSVTISQRSQSVYDWIKECFEQSPELDFKPRIKRFLPETRQVEFIDGSVKAFDHIILGTGYHYHWPFLNKEDNIIKVYHDPESCSPVNKIGNLYMYAFSTTDNSFATVGIPTVNLMFHNMEYGAIAIAGVFSGAKHLPSLESQLAWDATRTQTETPEVPHRYQGFHLDKLDEQLFEPLFALAPQGRERPLVKGQWGGQDFDVSNRTLQNIYLGLKNGHLKECDILKV